jgi:hypothetical protein
LADALGFRDWAQPRGVGRDQAPRPWRRGESDPVRRPHDGPDQGAQFELVEVIDYEQEGFEPAVERCFGEGLEPYEIELLEKQQRQLFKGFGVAEEGQGHHAVGTLA